MVHVHRFSPARRFPVVSVCAFRHRCSKFARSPIAASWTRRWTLQPRIGRGLMTTATLGFTVRPVANGADLRRACEVRAAGYGHHLPGWKQSLIEPDALDRDG